ncbi:unnamed protein product [Cuscuta europaea]|uniref:Uncharacterized protein n=1 Tax=Cuscuta europaea TaxID=41803 RepID=A0A9P0Z2G0_CUSEU|nr:unnamed protein product [Cuscuta europaea]
MSTHKRGVDWRYNEDIFLCNSWVSIYEDGAVGNINQTGDSFWFRVHMFFCQKANAIVRTEEAVESGVGILIQRPNTRIKKAQDTRPKQRAHHSMMSRSSEEFMPNEIRPK